MRLFHPRTRRLLPLPPPSTLIDLLSNRLSNNFPVILDLCESSSKFQHFSLVLLPPRDPLSLVRPTKAVRAKVETVFLACFLFYFLAISAQTSGVGWLCCSLVAGFEFFFLTIHQRTVLDPTLFLDLANASLAFFFPHFRVYRF